MKRKPPAMNLHPGDAPIPEDDYERPTRVRPGAEPAEPKAPVWNMIPTAERAGILLKKARY